MLSLNGTFKIFDTYIILMTDLSQKSLSMMIKIGRAASNFPYVVSFINFNISTVPKNQRQSGIMGLLGS